MADNRFIELVGGDNFRDLGGLKNADGKKIKKGKLIRGGEMHRLTDEDLTLLSSIPIHSIVDFREGSEIEHAPDKHPISLKSNYLLSIIPGNVAALREDEITDYTEETGDSFMCEMYKLLVTEQECQERYQHFFSLLQDENNAPVLFHCTAGKDRSGMAAALILSALKVDFELIMEDYLLSNRCLEKKYGEIKSRNPFLKSMLGVKPDLLAIAFDTINTQWGSAENYLKQVLKVDINRMQKLYLEE